MAALMLLLPACYHMRVMPEPIQPRIVTAKQAPEEVLRRIRKALEKELRVRVLDEKQDGFVLITFPHHFFTDTSAGQPPGGRKYYVQLWIIVERQDGRTMVTVAPHNFELRTSYAYSDEGQLHTLTKIYPYEEYPGMFDTVAMTREVQMVAGVIDRSLKE